MLAENPYKSPSADCPGVRKVLPYRYYPPDKCPCCETKVTLLKYSLQGNTDYYRCRACKTKYRIVVPWMSTIQLIFGSVLLLLFVGVPIAGLKLGLTTRELPSYFFLWLASIFCWNFFFIKWYFQHLQKHGKLIPWGYYEEFDTCASEA